MECVEKLKEIGAKKINAKTKIDARRLEDIFECRFDQMDRTRAKGFLGILQREYCIDMSEWLQKYDDFHEQNHLREAIEAAPKEEKRIQIAFIDATQNKKQGLLIAFGVLVVLFVVYFIYNNAFNPKKSKDNLAQNAPQTAAQMPLDEPRPAYSDLYKLEPSEALPTAAQEGGAGNLATDLPKDSPRDSRDSQDSPAAANLVAAAQTPTTSQAPQPSAAESSRVDSARDNLAQNNPPQDSPLQDSQSLAAPLPANEAATMTITPKSPLWLGIIDLQTNRKKQLSISAEQSFTLEHPSLITTGHGHFDISVGDFARQYIDGNNKHFHWTKTEGLKEITRREFLALNKGQEW